MARGTRERRAHEGCSGPALEENNSRESESNENESECKLVCVCMYACIVCVCVGAAAVVCRSRRTRNVSCPRQTLDSVYTCSRSLSHSLGSLSRLNLPLEYPMGPFYKGKFCDRARETTDTATATRKRVTERERGCTRTTNENKSEQTKQWTKRLRSLVRVEKRQKQGILCCHRRGRCCCCLLPACAAFFEFYKSVFHFLFHIIQPFSL